LTTMCIALVLSVVVKVQTTPFPVKFHSPQRVIVTGGVPDIVAYLALGVAIVTLIAVGAQIYIAWRELEYVKEDLKNQRKQMKELFKRPRFEMEFKPQDSKLIAGRRANAVVHVVNRGDGSSKQCRFRLWFPPELDAPTDWPTHEWGNVTYRTLTNTADILYADGDSRLLAQFEARFADRCTLLWDADDEFGHYPDTPTGFGALQIAPDGATSAGAVPACIPVRPLKKEVNEPQS